MRVIGIAGQMQNGKDTVADYLAEKIGWGRYAFATGVKEVYCDAFGVDLDFIEKWKTNPEPPPGFDMPVRQGLQFIGDGFRKIVPTIWVDRCFRELEVAGPTVLSDVRYMNEAIAINGVNERRAMPEGDLQAEVERAEDEDDIETLGLTVLVWRPGKENTDPNGSEAQMRPYMEWCRDTGYEGWISNWEDSGEAEQDCPENTHNIAVFLRNEGSIEDLYAKIDKHIIPLIELKGLVIPF
jgi:hypothetical protein